MGNGEWRADDNMIDLDQGVKDTAPINANTLIGLVKIWSQYAALGLSPRTCHLQSNKRIWPLD